MKQSILSFIKREALFFLVALLSVGTSFLILPRWRSIDWKVVCSLFNLMLISLAFSKYHLLDRLAVSILTHFHTPRSIGMAMIPTTAFIAMFITNDVALLTIVPLTLITAKKSGFLPYKLITLETIAANIGSSLTPFGNPQNLFLYAAYKINTGEFLLTMLPFTALGILLLILMNFRTEHKPLEYTLESIQIRQWYKLAIYVSAFVGVLLSILRMLDYRIVTLMLIVLFAVWDRELFKKIDYYLLGTFVGFFIFIDNLSRLELLSTILARYMDSPAGVFTLSSLVSQIMSNVPTAILFSGFTTHYRALLLGVSLGGLGTMIASLANLISYKLYVKEFGPAIYPKFFYRVNILLFVILYAGIILFLF